MLVVVFWVVMIYASLWQQSFFVSCRAAIEYSEELRIFLQPVGLRSQLVARGYLGGQLIEIRWCGGISGEYTTISSGSSRQRYPLLSSEKELRDGLMPFLEEDSIGDAEALLEGNKENPDADLSDIEESDIPSHSQENS